MSKSALIIGGSSGIGSAIVEKLASASFNVCVIHRDRRQFAEQFVASCKNISMKEKVVISTFNIDGTNESKIEGFLEELDNSVFETFDLVVHALSRGNLKDLTGNGPVLSQQDFALTIDAMGINLHTWVIKLLNRNFLRDGSRILALTSEGNKKFWPGYGAVATAKAALENIAQYLAVELAEKGITVNIIQAGITDTTSLRMIPGAETLLSETADRNPFGRLTTPQDVANFVYLITLPEARWVNGALIHVDGGEHLK
ncbi:MAG: SDR family oxidoreductase [Bacteroidota bacterium]